LTQSRSAPLALAWLALRELKPVALPVASFVALMSRLNRVRAVSTGLAALTHPNSTQPELQALFAHSLLRLQLLTLRQIRRQLKNAISNAKFPRLRMGRKS
jgi:hypothetical protein